MKYDISFLKWLDKEQILFVRLSQSSTARRTNEILIVLFSSSALKNNEIRSGSGKERKGIGKRVQLREMGNAWHREMAFLKKAREEHLTSLTMLSLGTPSWIYARVKVIVDAPWYAVPCAHLLRAATAMSEIEKERKQRQQRSWRKTPRSENASRTRPEVYPLSVVSKKIYYFLIISLFFKWHTIYCSLRILRVNNKGFIYIFVFD